jgi:hypothetical protein
MQARLIHLIGTLVSLRIYWHNQHVPCTNGGDYHDTTVEIARSSIIDDETTGGTVVDHIDDPRWGKSCSSCGLAVPVLPDPISFRAQDNVHHQVFRKRLYDTVSGRPEPGDLFWTDWYQCSQGANNCPYGWANCDGRHLMAILPNGWDWDIMSRASNCDMKNDATHRCWVLHGEPPMVHVDKVGHTCRAGAGSIVAPGWHGFLHQGVFTQC